MRREPDQERDRVEEIIYRKFPQVAELLVTDAERTTLRVVLQCPKGHPIETVVLDVDHNLHLFLRSLVEYESDTDTEMTENAVAATKWQSPDSMTTARVKLPCPRKKCNYNGTKTEAELLRLFVTARFVLDTPGIRLPD